MPQPSNATVSFDDVRFNAMSTTVGLSTHHDDRGMPQMGTSRFALDCTVDMHDDSNLPYTQLQKLFDFANGVTRDKIKTVKVEFWKDEAQQDALCTYTFQGWISNFTTSGGGGSNHILSLSIQPALDQKQFNNVVLGN